MLKAQEGEMLKLLKLVPALILLDLTLEGMNLRASLANVETSLKQCLPSRPVIGLLD